MNAGMCKIPATLLSFCMFRGFLYYVSFLYHSSRVYIVLDGLTILLGIWIARYWPVSNLQLGFEALTKHSRRVWWCFVRGSREILPVPSLYRASTDAAIL